MARPTKYSTALLEKAQHYLDNYEEYGEVIPSAVGLALVLNIRRSTLYEWAKAACISVPHRFVAQKSAINHFIAEACEEGIKRYSRNSGTP